MTRPPVSSTCSRPVRSSSAAFAPEEVRIRNMLAEIFAREKIHNLRIAETGKYAHVTYSLTVVSSRHFPAKSGS